MSNEKATTVMPEQEEMINEGNQLLSRDRWPDYFLREVEAYGQADDKLEELDNLKAKELKGTIYAASKCVSRFCSDFWHANFKSNNNEDFLARANEIYDFLARARESYAEIKNLKEEIEKYAAPVLVNKPPTTPSMPTLRGPGEEDVIKFFHDFRVLLHSVLSVDEYVTFDPVIPTTKFVEDMKKDKEYSQENFYEVDEFGNLYDPYEVILPMEEHLLRIEQMAFSEVQPYDKGCNQEDINYAFSCLQDRIPKFLSRLKELENLVNKTHRKL